MAGAVTVTGLVIAQGPLLAKTEALRQVVYVWGRREAMPGGAEGDVLWPKRVKWFEDHEPGWEKIRFGPNFGAALDRKGCLFIWGQGITEGTFVGPMPVEIKGEARGRHFVDVQCSSTKIFALARDGNVYFFEGILDTLRHRYVEEAAAAANGEGNKPLPAAMTLQGGLMPGLPRPGMLGRVLGGSGGVKEMGIGMEHAAFVTRSGDLYCIGSNQWGQCGVMPPRQKGPMGALEERGQIEVMSPVRVRLPEAAGPIVGVSVGGRHTVAVDASGKAFSFGDDRRIQLGLGDTRTGGSDERNSYGVLHQDALGGKRSKGDMRRAAVYRYYDPHMQASPMETAPPIAYNRPSYPPPSLITCGEDFTVAVHRDSPDWYTDDQVTNVIMCCGENGQGQCGRSLQQQQQPWTQARLPKRTRTVAVATGQAHSLALLSTGDLYAWGGNDQGQLGNGKRAMVNQPARVVLKRTTEKRKPEKTADGRLIAPAPTVEEFPGNIAAISCGFRNSSVICEVPLGSL